MDQKLKEAIEALAGFAAGRPPMAADAFEALKGVRFSTGGGEELMAFMTALDGEKALTQNERERVVSILSYAEQAMDGGEALVIGFVNEQLEPSGNMLSVREGSFVQMLANVCWGITTRLDEPMPRMARAPAATAAAAIDPDSLPSLGAVIVNPTSTPGPTPTQPGRHAQPPPAEPQEKTPPPAPAPPAGPKFMRMSVTGPEDPRWLHLRSLADPLLARRAEALKALDLPALKAIDKEIEEFEEKLIGRDQLQEFLKLYDYDNSSRLHYYLLHRRNEPYVDDVAAFERRFGPVALMP